MVQVQPGRTCMWEVIRQQEKVSARHPHLLPQIRRTVHMPRRKGDTAVMDDPWMESLYHAPPTTVDTTTADDEACVQPLMGDSGHRVTTPEQAGELAVDTEWTSPDVDDVGCGDDGGCNNSNIVTRMRRKPWSPKPAAVHDSPFTDPTRLPGARKSKKEMKDEVTGADEPPVVDDPAEGSVDLPVLDVQPLKVEGLGISPSVGRLYFRTLVNKGDGVADQGEEECFFALDMCADVDGQGGGHAQVSAEACVSKLVTRPHPRGSKGGSRGQVILHNKGHIWGVIWDTLKATPQPGIRYVRQHQLLSLETHLQNSIINMFGPAAEYSGHDYGVFVMAFMELLSLKVDGFEFDQDCVSHYRDKCLVSQFPGPGYMQKLHCTLFTHGCYSCTSWDMQLMLLG
ncbi:hypothetical protein Cgig2_008826 [Carnegiea gigantea]|uniref:Uncharacterized protein n=1 Tax=Carnegiea gigantea TaxID=171969 RepID=A0A9Q1JR75_9CARY|nr:hypothetical protein Cgig2_008826 [Carnegiea gigantea]